MTVRIVPDDDAGRGAAIDALRGGGIVALPTDTVYGIAVGLDTPGGIEALFAAKHRPPERGIALLLADAAQAPTIGQWPAAAATLAASFWPGGLTIVVRRRSDVELPAALTGGAPTIGLRVPDHPAPRAQEAVEIVAQLGDAIELVLDGGPARGGPASTVVDCSVDPPRIMRHGAISDGAIEAVLAEVAR